MEGSAPSDCHPYDSKYGAYLEGRAELTPAEARGLAPFDDSTKGNCAACHLDRPTPDGRPPMFTDFEYEALGVPHEPDGEQNAFTDLGLCGPTRHDLAGQPQYCGLFRTPSLRNVATRRAFFHDGALHSLEQVLAFYDFRDARPDLAYPRQTHGGVARLSDLPDVYRANLDTVDAPFGRRAGDAPPLTAQEMREIIAFLGTLTDGYRGPRP